MTPKEFVAKHAKKLPPDPCYGIEPTNEDELLADFHAAVESLMPNDREQGESAVEYGKKYALHSVGDVAVVFHHGALWLRSRILEAIEQNVREK